MSTNFYTPKNTIVVTPKKICFIPCKKSTNENSKNREGISTLSKPN